MLDIKKLRSNDPETLAGVKRRGKEDLLAEFARRDGTYKAMMREVEDLRAKQNQISSKFAQAKQAGTAIAEVQREAAELKKQLAAKEEGLKAEEEAMKPFLLTIPNALHPSVPDGKGEQDNPVVRTGTAPKEPGFAAKDHAAIGEALGILDFETAGKMSGSRFTILKGAGARLERALLQFMLDLAGEHGYVEVAPPLLVTPETLTGTGQLPKFEEDQYKTSEDPLYLIPTAEVPLTNLHRGESIDEARLPIRYTAGTPCFRREAGSYGKDTRGMIRQHQFNKVELVWLVKPEDSMAALETLTGHAEAVLTRLGLPHRVIELCTADVGFSAAKTYDLEVWFPGEKRWREVSSCSNCTDFQARRIGTRVKRAGGRTELVHTLNGSGVAAGRILAAILENFQQADGSVVVPEALRRYTGFDRIAKA